MLWDDLNFEREFALIPRDIISTIPPATSLADVPFDRWREVNADGVIVGTVQKMGDGIRVEVRLYNMRTRQSAFGRVYTGSVASKRLFAHSISDELHLQQRALRGVARTKLTFNSDRDGERMARHDRESRRQGDLHRRLRRREPAASDHPAIVEHEPHVVARRPVHRVRVIPRGQPQILISNIYKARSTS